MKDYLENLEKKVDDLAELCQKLHTENTALRNRENEWLNERRQLIMKNESARNKVDAIITRLKAMETSE